MHSTSVYLRVDVCEHIYMQYQAHDDGGSGIIGAGVWPGRVSTDRLFTQIHVTGSISVHVCQNTHVIFHILSA